MIKHPEDRYQRRLIREKKSAEKARADKVRLRIKQSLQDQETKDELRTYGKPSDI